MKTLAKLYFILFVFILSCTTEEVENEYTVSFRNSSESELAIKGFNSNTDDIVFEINLQSEEIVGQIKYFSPSFGGYIANADSIVFSFRNDKGYSCDLSQNGGILCFENKHPLVGNINNFNDLGNNTYEFIITQEDYENAHELPEE